MSLNPNNDVTIRLGAENPELESVLKQTAAIIEAALKKIESGFESLERQTKENTKDMVGAIRGLERDTQKSAKSLTGIVGGVKNVFAGLFAALAAGTAARFIGELIEISDKHTELNSQLKLVTSSEEELLAVREKLYEITKETRGDLGSTINLYARLARSTQELDVSQADLLEVTKAINQALIVSGANGESARAAIVQLSQGMASGTLRGEELNSVLEQTPRIAEMIARGMGISYGEIRKYAQEGKITTEVMIEAIKNQSKVVDEEFGKMEVTVGQAMQNLNTVYESIIYDGSRAAGSTRSIADAVQDFADTLEENREEIITAFTNIADSVKVVFERMVELVNFLYEHQSILAGTIGAFVGFRKGGVPGAVIGFAGAATASEVYRYHTEDHQTDRQRRLSEIWRRQFMAEYGYDPRAVTYDETGAPVNMADEIVVTAKKDDGGGGDDDGDGSQMGQWRKALNERRIYYDEENKLRRMSLADEVAYWENILQTQKMSVKDRERVERILSQTRLRMRSQELKQQDALSAMEINSIEDAAMHELDLERQMAKQKYDLGEMSLSQYQQQLMKFENKRYQIALEAQQRRIELAKLGPEDPVQAQKNFDKLLELYRKHQLRIQEVNKEIEKEQQRQLKELITNMSQGIGDALGQFMTGMATFGDFLKNLYQSIQSAFAQMLGKMMADWIKYLMKKLIALITANSEEAASSVAAGAITAGAAKTTAAATVPATAATAGGKAASSVAEIPIVGPALAAAAYASTFKMIMDGLSVFSAEGGYDIPAGVNPLTQLHSREMVLPATYADLIRDMASANDGKKAGSGDTHIHISAVDARSIRKLLEREGGAIFDSLKTQIRRFRR